MSAKAKKPPQKSPDELALENAERNFLMPDPEYFPALEAFRKLLDATIAASYKLQQTPLRAWTAFNLQRICGEYVKNQKAATYFAENKRLDKLNSGSIDDLLSLFNMNIESKITNSCGYHPYHHDDITICSEHFNDIQLGAKKFIILAYDKDHDYVPGDRITLAERTNYDPTNTIDQCFGRRMSFTIGFVSDYAVFPGYACLSLLGDAEYQALLRSTQTLI